MRGSQIKDGGRSERGAALIVSLLLLLVLTILGVTAMNSSIMQGFMSSSYQQQARALAGAENILLRGERDIETRTAPLGGGLRGLNYFIDLAPIPMPNPPPTQFPAQFLGTAWPNDFVVEYMGQFNVPGESIAEGGGFADSRIFLYRVSARGTEVERGGLRIVQSYYVALRDPG
jgi:type IV pilus assembly protein PilX